MLFANSGTPRIDAEECALLDAANCRAMFCHSERYAELIRKHRRPANQSPIVLCPYPIDPSPGEPLSDEYDLLIYAKNGYRLHLLEHVAEAFPRQIQIHYGSYRREEVFEAATIAGMRVPGRRRPRAVGSPGNSAGCPTVGVRTGASFVRNAETGIVFDRLPHGSLCLHQLNRPSPHRRVVRPFAFAT